MTRLPQARFLTSLPGSDPKAFAFIDLPENATFDGAPFRRAAFRLERDGEARPAAKSADHRWKMISGASHLPVV